MTRSPWPLLISIGLTVAIGIGSFATRDDRGTSESSASAPDPAGGPGDEDVIGHRVSLAAGFRFDHAGTGYHDPSPPPVSAMHRPLSLALVF
ncbi:MAG: hypothetical protein ACJ71Z_09750, partial [Aeromicrobium sp.]